MHDLDYSIISIILQPFLKTNSKCEICFVEHYVEKNCCGKKRWFKKSAAILDGNHVVNRNLGWPNFDLITLIRSNSGWLFLFFFFFRVAGTYLPIIKGGCYMFNSSLESLSFINHNSRWPSGLYNFFFLQTRSLQKVIIR